MECLEWPVQLFASQTRATTAVASTLPEGLRGLPADRLIMPALEPVPATIGRAMAAGSRRPEEERLAATYSATWPSKHPSRRGFAYGRTSGPPSRPAFCLQNLREPWSAGHPTRSLDRKAASEPGPTDEFRRLGRSTGTYAIEPPTGDPA